jgi:hypothetical protein
MSPTVIHTVSIVDMILKSSGIDKEISRPIKKRYELYLLLVGREFEYECINPKITPILSSQNLAGIRK